MWLLKIFPIISLSHMYDCFGKYLLRIFASMFITESTLQFSFFLSFFLLLLYPHLVLVLEESWFHSLFYFIFWWHWGSNSGPYTGTLLLEPLHQPDLGFIE
jgi:hypothetical protein